jgi:hypothetical protein
MSFAEHPVAEITRKNFTCRVFEGPVCAKPGIHWGRRPYYIQCNGHAMLGGIWDEQLAIAAAKALAKRKAKRCGIHQGTGG